MKTSTDFNQQVWFFNYQGEIETSTYAKFLKEYWADETTSPRGCENREQVCSFIIENGDIVQYSINNSDGLLPDADQELKWGVRSWGIGGRGPSSLVSELFDTEEEAETRILEGMEYDLQNSSNNRPTPYFSEIEIREQFEEIILDKIMDKIRDRY